MGVCERKSQVFSHKLPDPEGSFFKSKRDRTAVCALTEKWRNPMLASNTLICLAAIVILPAIAVVIVLLRYLSYRETLALAEKGLVRPGRENDGKDALRWGIIITALGLALCLGLYPFSARLDPSYPLGMGPWMLLGLAPLFFGLALILIYVLTRSSK
jgi:hypothetical protein